MKTDFLNTPTDHERRAHEDHHASLRLWLRLLSCTTLVENKIRHNLKHGFEMSLPRFDLMAQLERHQEGLTMGELSKRLMVSGGNITVIVDQLEQEQIVQRQATLGDRRSYRVVLTKHGRQAFKKMALAHEAWVVELFSSLSAHEQAQLHQLLGKLKQGIYAFESFTSSELA